VVRRKLPISPDIVPIWAPFRDGGFNAVRFIDLKKVRSPGWESLGRLSADGEFLTANYIIPAEVRDHDAASEYAELTNLTAAVGSVSLVFEKDFLSEEDLNAFVHAHPNLNLITEPSDDRPEDPGVRRLLYAYQARAEIAMPEIVRDTFTRYWKDHFKGGYLLLSLGNAERPDQRVIFAPLAILDEQSSKSSVTVSFRQKEQAKLVFGNPFK
jgi:hypothetical protein